MLNEYSTHRQVNTFFPYEQAIFYGIPVNHVNTSRGTATFARRDMMLVGRNPIVMARIYDSSLEHSDDFGQGWQLSYQQTIEVLANGSLLYQDDSATLSTFNPETVGFKIDVAYNADIQSVTFNPQGWIEIDYIMGWQKQFQKLGDKYRLVRIVDNNNNRNI